MSLHRFFLTEAIPAGADAPALLPLAPEDLHHAVAVLRIRAGEQIECVGPDGSVATVRVTEATAAGIAYEVVAHSAAAVRGRPDVVLVQGVAKGEKMDAIVRQAVEVGADEVWPVLTSRSVVKLDERKRVERAERWRRIAKSAAEQAHRDSVPAVSAPMSLAEAGEELRGFDACVVAWEDERATSLAEALAPWRGRSDARIALVVGPEGGLSEAEVETLREGGAVTATLGRSILRTETAAVVAVALAVHELERA